MAKAFQRASLDMQNGMEHRQNQIELQQEAQIDLHVQQKACTSRYKLNFSEG